MGERRKIGYRYNAVDIHSHILPGCDETGWFWRWKGSDQEVGLKNLGGVEW